MIIVIIGNSFYWIGRTQSWLFLCYMFLACFPWFFPWHRLKIYIWFIELWISDSQTLVKLLKISHILERNAVCAKSKRSRLASFASCMKVVTLFYKVFTIPNGVTWDHFFQFCYHPIKDNRLTFVIYNLHRKTGLDLKFCFSQTYAGCISKREWKTSPRYSCLMTRRC